MIKRPEYDLLKTGEQIRKLRKERNITVEQIRRYLQFGSAQAIYKWENGRCFPQADNLLALARLFNINPTDIMVEDKRHLCKELLERICCYLELKKEKKHMYSAVSIKSEVAIHIRKRLV